MRIFVGYRPEPPAEYVGKGITNAGKIGDYEGIIFGDGTVAIRWLTAYRSHSIWACWEDFYQVHGHPEYGTEIVFQDGLPAPAGNRHYHEPRDQDYADHHPCESCGGCLTCQIHWSAGHRQWAIAAE